MPYIATVNDIIFEGNATYMNSGQHHECALFVQAVAYNKQTKFWQKGVNVLSAPAGTIRRGTAIVMFNGDQYDTSAVHHAAIYLSHNANGITVFDQWNSQGMVKKRTIRKGLLVQISVNNALLYHVLE